MALIIFLPGKAADPWITGCRGVTGALNRSSAPIFEAMFDPGAAVAI